MTHPSPPSIRRPPTPHKVLVVGHQVVQLVREATDVLGHSGLASPSIQPQLDHLQTRHGVIGACQSMKQCVCVCITVPTKVSCVHCTLLNSILSKSVAEIITTRLQEVPACRPSSAAHKTCLGIQLTKAHEATTSCKSVLIDSATYLLNSELPY